MSALLQHLPSAGYLQLQLGLAPMKTAFLTFLKREDGPTAVEYAVMLALIVVACMGTIFYLAGTTADSYDTSAMHLASALGS